MASARMRLPLLSFAGVLVAIGMAVQSAGAETPKAELKGASLVEQIKPEEGFIDEPVAFDEAGTRLLYVNSQTGTSAQLVVVDLVQHTELFRVPLRAFTLKPLRAEFALDGQHFLVWDRDAKSGLSRAALVDSRGRVRRKFGPAQDLVRSRYDGHDVIVAHKVGPVPKAQAKGARVRHSVSVVRVDNGKRLGKEGHLDLDDSDRSPALEFTLKYWAKDFTVAVGIKGGVYDAKEDQRSPDVEGWYLMPTSTFSKRLAIDELMSHREKMERMAKVSTSGRDVVVKRDRSSIDFVDDGNFYSLTLAEAWHHYDPTTLHTQHGVDGSIFFSVAIDPVHPDAAAKRKAVRPWVDLYQLDVANKKATRRARFIAPKGRDFHWRANSRYWAIMPRYIGFDRGGTDLQIYQLK